MDVNVGTVGHVDNSKPLLLPIPNNSVVTALYILEAKKHYANFIKQREAKKQKRSRNKIGK